MNLVTLRQELYQLIRMVSDATIDYESKLRESGQEALSNEWRYNMHDILGDIPHIARELESLYAASREDDIRFYMTEFLEHAVGETALSHTREHMRRLSDILEGRTPSWPVDPGPIDWSHDK